MVVFLASVLTIIWTFVLWRLYHKYVAVIYTDLLGGIIKELLACFFAGLVLAELTIHFLGFFGKLLIGVLVVFVILALIPGKTDKDDTEGE